jgi:hypothetical protein
MSPDEVRERFEEIVDFAGIGEFVNLPVGPIRPAWGRDFGYRNEAGTADGRFGSRAR